MHSAIIRSNHRANIYFLSHLKCYPSPTINGYYTFRRNHHHHQQQQQQQQQQHQRPQQRNMSNETNCAGIEVPVQQDKLLKLCRTAIPKLTNLKHKGQYGRIGIIGGSLEYTGAPYFAAIAALKVGSDLAHVFCQRDAAICIKSYSPELIVHPLLDANNAVELIAPWLNRLHVVIIGPGLGRDPNIQKVVIELITVCVKQEKPMIIDADGLAILMDNLDLVQGQRNIILTPNAIEFRRLFGDDNKNGNGKSNYERISLLGDGVIVLEKGALDRVHIPNTTELYTFPSGGSGRRCGGQGDILCGALATFFHWFLEAKQANPGFLAAFAASYLVKQCNAMAFQKLGRGMLASDMITEIPNVFGRLFDINEQTPSPC